MINSMKAVFIILLALFFTIEGSLIEGPNLEDTASIKQTIIQLSPFLLAPLKNLFKKATREGSVIAQAYQAIVLLASETNPNTEFLHYIEVYSSIRMRNYFLLI